MNFPPKDLLCVKETLGQRDACGQRIRSRRVDSSQVLSTARYTHRDKKLVLNDVGMKDFT